MNHGILRWTDLRRLLDWRCFDDRAKLAQTCRHFCHHWSDCRMGGANRFLGGDCRELADSGAGDLLPDCGNCMGFAAETPAPLDGNGTFQRLKRTVRRTFIEITVLGNQITTSHADGNDLPALEALAQPSARDDRRSYSRRDRSRRAFGCKRCNAAASAVRNAG